MAEWQEGDKEEFIFFLHKMDTSCLIKKKTPSLALADLLTKNTLFLFLSAMGRRPEIHHTQLQGQQCQSHDMPQETVSFICMILCFWLLSSKQSD